MTVSVSPSLKGAMAAAAYALIGTSSTIDILGSDGAVLVSFPLGGAWATLSGTGIALAAAPLTATAVATGSADSFRLVSASGAVHVSGSVSLSPDSGDVVIDRVQIVAGGSAKIAAWRMSVA